MTVSCKLSRKPAQLGALSGMYLFSMDNCRPLMKIKPESAVDPQNLEAPTLSIVSMSPDGRNKLPVLAGIPSAGGDIVYYSACRQNSPHCYEGLAYSSPITLQLAESGDYSITARSCVWNDRALSKNSKIEKRINQVNPDQLNCGLKVFSEAWIQMPIQNTRKLNNHINLMNLKIQIHRHLYQLKPILVSWLESGSKIPKYLSRQIENLLYFRDPLHSFIFQKHFWATLDMTQELLVAYSALSSKIPFSKGVMDPCASEREVQRMQHFAYTNSSQSSYSKDLVTPPDLTSDFFNRPASRSTDSVRQFLSSPKTLVALTILSMGGIVTLDDTHSKAQILLSELQSEVHKLYQVSDQKYPHKPKFIVGVGVGHAVTNTFKLFRSTFLSEKEAHEDSNYHIDFIHINKLRAWSGTLLTLLSQFQKDMILQSKDELLQEPVSNY